MIARLLGAGISIVVYLGAATLMAEAILGGYLWIAWKMDRNRAIQMLAIAQGIDLFAAARAHADDEDDPGTEQPSLEQLIAARTAKDLDLTVREQALRNGTNQLASAERQYAEKLAKYEQIKGAFETELQESQSAAKIAGMDENRLILEGMKPAQAKAQLALMLEDGKIDEVVVAVRDMQARLRTKIFAEFKTPEEEAQLSKILEMIREGRPAVTLAEQTANQLAGGGQDGQEGGNP